MEKNIYKIILIVLLFWVTTPLYPEQSLLNWIPKQRVTGVLPLPSAYSHKFNQLFILNDNKLGYWDLNDFIFKEISYGSKDKIHTLKTDDVNNTLIITTETFSVIIYDLSLQKVTFSANKLPWYISSVKINKKTNEIYLLCYDSLFIFSLNSQKELLRKKIHFFGSSDMILDKYGFITTSFDQSIKKWNVQSFSLSKQYAGKNTKKKSPLDSILDFFNWKSDLHIKAHRAPIYAISASPDGKWLASASKNIKLWNRQTGSEITSFKLPSLCYQIKFSKNNQLVFFSGGLDYNNGFSGIFSINVNTLQLQDKIFYGDQIIPWFVLSSDEQLVFGQTLNSVYFIFDRLSSKHLVSFCIEKDKFACKNHLDKTYYSSHPDRIILQDNLFSNDQILSYKKVNNYTYLIQILNKFKNKQ